MQPAQRGSRGSPRLSELIEILVAAPGQYLGDEVLLAVEELVDRCRRVARQVGDSSQRAGPESVFAEDPVGGVEDLASVLGAAGGAPLCGARPAGRISNHPPHK